MMTPARKIFRSFLRLCLAAFLGGLMLSTATSAWAAVATPCLPGLPCPGVAATPNLSNSATDGPNATGSPNARKNSPNSTASACDADFMNQIYSRAWLESQRDNIKAEILIRKPDSVLEYSCFNQLARITGREAGPLFTDNTYWHNKTVSIDGDIGNGSISDVTLDVYFGGGRLTDSINKLVQDSLGQYINNASFSHRFLGGSATTLDYTAPGGGYDCSYMEQVNFLAKCSDILTDDRFWTFTDLITPDPRQLVQACSNTLITQPKIDLAENKDFVNVNFDRVTPYNNLLSQPGGTPPTCAGPIPTGLTVTDKIRSVDAQGNVTITSTNTYDDNVCPQPNCYYCPKNNACYLPEASCPPF